MNDKLFEKYISKKYSGSRLTAYELEAVKSGSIGKLVEAFLGVRDEKMNLQLVSAFELMQRYLGERIQMTDFQKIQEITLENAACQIMDGDRNVLFAIAGSNEALLNMAGAFAGENFDRLDNDAYDALCEFVNCISGQFAGRLSNLFDSEVQLHPPVMCEHCRVQAKNDIYVTTFLVDGSLIEMITVCNATLIQ